MKVLRPVCSIVLSVALNLLPITLYAQNVQPESSVSSPSLSDLLSKSYFELMSGNWTIDQPTGDAFLATAKKERDQKVSEDKKQIKQIDSQIKNVQKSIVAQKDQTDADRTIARCDIVSMEKQRLSLLADKRAAKIDYENKEAKVQLLENFTTDKNTKHVPDYGRVDDIGIRPGFGGQEKDIRWGQQIVQEMQKEHALPPELVAEAQKHLDIAKAELLYVDDEQKKIDDQRAKDKTKTPNNDSLTAANNFILNEKQNQLDEEKQRATRQQEMAEKEVALAQFVTDYVSGVEQRIATASDVKVPVTAHVIWDDTPNAFALPGGTIYINSGLLYDERKSDKKDLGVDNESELAGVLGHESAHIAERHAHKLMVRADILGMIEEGGFLALMFVFPPATYGAYYLLQLEQMGAEFLIDLRLLGVSRSHEAQADLLGTEYAWNAGYDPTGFINYFDKMSSNLGGVQGLGWFSDHPPSYDRMLASYLELKNLPKKDNLVTNTTQFDQAKDMMTQLYKLEHTEKDMLQKGAPSMLGPFATPPSSCPTFEQN